MQSLHKNENLLFKDFQDFLIGSQYLLKAREFAKGTEEKEGEGVWLRADLTDPQGRHAHIFRHPVLAQAQRFHEIFQRYFAGMHRGKLFYFLLTPASLFPGSS
jgi:hypothetical protein